MLCIRIKGARPIVYYGNLSIKKELGGWQIRNRDEFDAEGQPKGIALFDRIMGFSECQCTEPNQDCYHCKDAV
tara:strand:+ start:643 stop:861 length:219 start_codon:yes stop_codon:yes gene_type:complete